MKKRDTIAQLERLYLAKERYEQLKRNTINNVKSETGKSFKLFDGTTVLIYFRRPYFKYPEEIKKQLEEARIQYSKEHPEDKGDVYISFTKIPTDED